MVIGSESNGVSDEIKNDNHQAVKIPGDGKS